MSALGRLYGIAWRAVEWLIGAVLWLIGAAVAVAAYGMVVVVVVGAVYTTVKVLQGELHWVVPVLCWFTVGLIAATFVEYWDERSGL